LRYNKDTKCCTYLPVLPNFIIGRILNHEADAGQGVASIRQRIAQQVAVTPLGLMQLPSYALMYEALSKGGFGRSIALLCPHYDSTEGGRCSIWAHRNSVCTTWFCKHTRGKVGATFWDALKALLEAVERDLAVHLALAGGIPPRVVEECSRMSPAHLREQYFLEVSKDCDSWSSRERWVAWYGRQEAFFRHCGDAVDGMSWTDVRGVCGPRLGMLSGVVKDAYDALVSKDLPIALRVAKLTLLPDGPTTSSVSTYRALDTLSLDNDLIQVLRYFDGRPHAAVVAEIEEKEDLSLDEPLLRLLLDYDILQQV
jgi:Fe-S-cluster containining protein